MFLTIPRYYFFPWVYQYHQSRPLSVEFKTIKPRQITTDSSGCNPKTRSDPQKKYICIHYNKNIMLQFATRLRNPHSECILALFGSKNPLNKNFGTVISPNLQPLCCCDFMQESEKLNVLIYCKT